MGCALCEGVIEQTNKLLGLLRTTGNDLCANSLHAVAVVQDSNNNYYGNPRGGKRLRLGVVIKAFDRSRMRTALGCTDALWRIAEAGAEQAIEVGNIRKASLQCDVANTDIAQVLCGKKHERMVQP
jgi:hypothetical protein